MTVRTVLLVDDSRVARMLTRRAIEAAHPDWRIHEAGTGEEACELAPGLGPDFIIVDVNMPGIDGVEAARRLKALCPTAAITLLTANIQTPVRLQAEEMGICFLAKPVREEELRAFLAGGGAAE